MLGGLLPARVSLCGSPFAKFIAKPQISLGKGGGIGNAPIRSFPPLAHPSSCIFKQCCHRAVQGKGRALSHRPRPLSAPWLKYISPFTQPSFKKLSLTPTTDLVVEFKDFQPEARHPPFVRFGCAIQTQICPGFQGAAALPPISSANHLGGCDLGASFSKAEGHAQLSEAIFLFVALELCFPMEKQLLLAGSNTVGIFFPNKNTRGVS